ncbi:uncharacterized protein MEPE_05357 [Melanopsichium pennsylvanicum]|uniref:HCP-like protein n=2 Tax=Melanopsichium pennsylvanicum TaxID=63383 RepID=A0AAJ4XT60_9BASI|nr:hcp-like protein [Melanopsichium pennsylvanicum 4]SNX86648.1 uncharacterized protein MEPE_05357 [Melanopsichium pennsylvanicum]
MGHLQPATYGTSAVRSFSAGFYGSSDGSSSSSAQDNAHDPFDSPSLSERSASSSLSSADHSAWTRMPHAHEPSLHQPAAGPSSGLSPLELLVKRGKQVQHDITDSATLDASSHRIYERASTLSRKSFVRELPIQPSPDPDDFDDSQSIRSVNLLSNSGLAFTRAQRSIPSSASTSPNPESSFSVERGYKASYDDTSDTYVPASTQPDSAWQRQSAHLLSNAFRNSVASDISFNSITGHALDVSLSRRASIDTVRSSEFGEDGRWGRAWASRAHDEESAYEDSAYGDDLDEDEVRSGIVDYSIELDPTRGPMASGSLASVAKQWRLEHAPQSGSSTLGRSSDANQPAMRQVANKEKIVSLTRSVPQPTSTARLQPTISYSQADPRHSLVPISNAESQQVLYDRTPMASADRYLGHHSTSSTSTITHHDGKTTTDSPPTARVYVYPPSPAGSEVSRVSGADEHRNSISTHSTTQQRYTSMPHPNSAQVETMINSPQQSVAVADEKKRTPLAPSSLLSNPRSVSAGAVRPKSSGHPAGRAPPPPPPTSADPITSQPNGMGYSDPNAHFQGVDRPIIGRKRAEAIARADGRESMVSDLDVETLRLDGSSRRDSSSTIASIMTSRMSIGSMVHDPTALQSAGTWHNGSSVVPQSKSLLSNNNKQSVLQAKASQASFRSMQPEQSAFDPNSRPQMLRNARSSTAISSDGPTGSVDMQSTISAPPAQLDLPSNGFATKPRTASPAVDTRTGPSSAEDFLSQGITYHEEGDLARSAFYFERSAKVDGGCVVGMCMFGMALREGWGARKDPEKGFTWIQKAAARAGELMSSTTPKSDSELKAIKSELKLSVYELGKCFCYGWGVKMDKHMALEYFELAAKLGDADAQAEAAALYAAGKGCKKDLKKAAYYYRLAEEGGYDTVGLSWIHKDKYK